VAGFDQGQGGDRDQGFQADDPEWGLVEFALNIRIDDRAADPPQGSFQVRRSPGQKRGQGKTVSDPNGTS